MNDFAAQGIDLQGKDWRRRRWVYVLQMHCPMEYVKIGFTFNIESRIHSFRTASPYEITVEKLWGPYDITFARKLERDLHEAFAHANVRSEWFDATPEDVEICAAQIYQSALVA